MIYIPADDPEVIGVLIGGFIGTIILIAMIISVSLGDWS